MKMLKRSKTFRLSQNNAAKKRDYPADATIEEALYAMAVGVVLEKTNMDADVSSFSSLFISSDS